MADNFKNVNRFVGVAMLRSERFFSVTLNPGVRHLLAWRTMAIKNTRTNFHFSWILGYC
jgi:hypothetical protein